jgi:hypothetical protein
MKSAMFTCVLVLCGLLGGCACPAGDDGGAQDAPQSNPAPRLYEGCTEAAGAPCEGGRGTCRADATASRNGVDSSVCEWGCGQDGTCPTSDTYGPGVCVPAIGVGTLCMALVPANGAACPPFTHAESRYAVGGGSLVQVCAPDPH